MEIQSLLSEEHIQRITTKQATLRDLRDSGLSVTDFARQRGVSRATIYRDIARAKIGATELADTRHQRSGRKIETPDNVTEWVITFLNAHPAASAAVVHRALKAHGQSNGWKKIPCYHSVWRLLRSIPADLQTEIRQGRRARLEQKALTIPRHVDLPNTKHQIDWSEIPIWSFDPVQGPKLFKPWIITSIDCATRTVLNAHVCKTVNGIEMLTHLKNAVLPTQDSTRPFYGLPQLASLDNHSVNKGDVAESIIMAGVEIDYIPKKSPEANGKIERFFETFQFIVAGLEGYTAQPNGMAKAQKKAIPYPLLQGIINRILVDYHLRENRCLKTTPWEAWHQSLDRAQGLVFDPKDVDMAFRYKTERKISEEGVQIDERHYTGDFLEGYVDEIVTLRVSPEGPGNKLPVYHKGSFLGEAKAVDTEMASAIREGRLNRTIEIASLKKALRERGSDVLPPSDAVEPYQEPPLSSEAPADEKETSEEPASPSPEEIHPPPDLPQE